MELHLTLVLPDKITSLVQTDPLTLAIKLLSLLGMVICVQLLANTMSMNIVLFFLFLIWSTYSTSFCLLTRYELNSRRMPEGCQGENACFKHGAYPA